MWQRLLHASQHSLFVVVLSNRRCGITPLLRATAPDVGKIWRINATSRCSDFGSAVTVEEAKASCMAPKVSKQVFQALQIVKENGGAQVAAVLRRQKVLSTT